MLRIRRGRRAGRDRERHTDGKKGMDRDRLRDRKDGQRQTERQTEIRTYKRGR